MSFGKRIFFLLPIQKVDGKHVQMRRKRNIIHDYVILGNGIELSSLLLSFFLFASYHLWLSCIKAMKILRTVLIIL